MSLTPLDALSGSGGAVRLSGHPAALLSQHSPIPRPGYLADGFIGHAPVVQGLVLRKNTSRGPLKRIFMV